LIPVNAAAGALPGAGTAAAYSVRFTVEVTAPASSLSQ